MVSEVVVGFHFGGRLTGVQEGGLHVISRVPCRSGNEESRGLSVAYMLTL